MPFAISAGFGPGTTGNGGKPGALLGGRAIGHGRAAKLDRILADGLTKLAKSTRQFMPGRMMRIGVNPGHSTEFRSLLTSPPKRTKCFPLIRDTEAEPWIRVSQTLSRTPRLS